MVVGATSHFLLTPVKVQCVLKNVCRSATGCANSYGATVTVGAGRNRENAPGPDRSGAVSVTGGALG